MRDKRTPTDVCGEATKAADLRKEAFDEFPLNIAIVLELLSRNALITA